MFKWEVSPEQKENILKWCEALESDQYIQGKSFLQTIDQKCCCMGVACLLSKDKLPSRFDMVTSYPPFDINQLYGLSMLLTQTSYIELGGLDFVSNSIPIQYIFAKWNDTYHLTFKEIAANI